MRMWPGEGDPPGFVRIGGRYVALPMEDHEPEPYIIPPTSDWSTTTTKNITANLLREHPDLLALEFRCDDLRRRFYQ